MLKPKITVALAAYNVEKYLNKALDSLVSQTFQSFELICIDDGSTDGTPIIMQEYANKDNRIKVIKKAKNEGLAVARNESLTIAKGKYIIFLDGDDIFNKDLLKISYDKAESDGSDLVMWDYHTFYSESELSHNLLEESALRNIDSADKNELLNRPAFTWIKLIKTDVARNLGVFFPIGLTRQDIPVHWQLITQINNISIIPQKLSFYRQQAEATTHRSDERLFDLAKVMKITETFLLETNQFETYKDTFLKHQLNFLHGMYDKADKDIKIKALKIVKESVNNLSYQYLDEDKPLRWQTKMFFNGLRGQKISQFKLVMWLFLRKIYRVVK